MENDRENWTIIEAPYSGPTPPKMAYSMGQWEFDNRVSHDGREKRYFYFYENAGARVWLVDYQEKVASLIGFRCSPYDPRKPLLDTPIPDVLEHGYAYGWMHGIEP